SFPDVSIPESFGGKAHFLSIERIIDSRLFGFMPLFLMAATSSRTVDSATGTPASRATCLIKARSCCSLRIVDGPMPPATFWMSFAVMRLPVRLFTAFSTSFDIGFAMRRLLIVVLDYRMWTRAAWCGLTEPFLAARAGDFLQLMGLHPAHEILHGGPRRFSFEQHAVQLAGDRHVDVVELRQPDGGAGRPDAFDDHAHFRQHVPERLAPADGVSAPV